MTVEQLKNRDEQIQELRHIHFNTVNVKENLWNVYKDGVCISNCKSEDEANAVIEKNKNKINEQINKLVASSVADIKAELIPKVAVIEEVDDDPTESNKFNDTLFVNINGANENVTLPAQKLREIYEYCIGLLKFYDKQNIDLTDEKNSLIKQNVEYLTNIKQNVIDRFKKNDYTEYIQSGGKQKEKLKTERLKFDNKIINDLNTIKKDKGAAFMSNSSTSSFVDEKDPTKENNSAQTNQTAVQQISNNIPNYRNFGMGETIPGLPNVDITTLVQNIMKQVTDVVMKEVTKEITTYAARHAAAAASVPVKMTKEVTNIVKTCTVDVGELTKELLDNTKDVKAEMTQTLKNNEILSQKIKEYTKEVSEKKKKIEDKVKAAINKIQTVLKYIDEGPEWVENELNKQINFLVNSVHNELEDRWYEHDKPMWDDLSNKMGNAIGLNKVQAASEELKKKLNEKFNKANSAISKAQTTAITAVKNVALTVAAKTGLL